LSVSTAPILAIDRLVKHYGGVHAVDDVTLTVERGSITGLIGPNGAGKSTVLNVVAGYLHPDSGTITFDGDDASGQPMHRMARRGVVRTFQLARVFGNLSALENLLVGAPNQRGEGPLGVLGGKAYWGRQEAMLISEAKDLMRSFGMAGKEDELAKNLSGGQKRAVEIMRALMLKPKLLLLDEPMAGLSPSLSTQLEDMFLELCAGGLSLLLVEHELDTVERICGKVIVMAHGKVLSEGTMSELRTRAEVQDAYVIG
jgi:ABC-type branched-subunit amino acid transport system ATPase component